MSYDQMRRLTEERARSYDAMTALIDITARENRDLTAEERSEWDKAEADVAIKSEDIERLQRSIALAQKFETIDSHAAELRGTSVAAVQADEEVQVRKVADAFRKYLVHGMAGLDNESRSVMQGQYVTPEQRAQGVATNSAGGYLVPPGFLQKITETMKAYGGLLNIANVIDTESGQPLQWPTNNDTGNVGGILGENTQISAQDLVLGTLTLGAYTYTSNLVLVSIQLLQDSAFDLETFLTRKLGQRLGRAVAAHLVTGTGTSQPTGIATAPTVGVTGTTGQTLSVIYDNLVDLVHSVDAAYRAGGNCKWVMNDLTLAAVRKIKDSQNRPLWVPGGYSANSGLAYADPDTLLGYPIVVDNAMPVMAANAYSILFGDFNAGVIVRRAQGVQLMRLDERYADYLQQGYFGFMRLDARPDDAAAVRAYRNSAT